MVVSKLQRRLLSNGSKKFGPFYFTTKVIKSITKSVYKKVIKFGNAGGTLISFFLTYLINTLLSMYKNCYMTKIVVINCQY